MRQAIIALSKKSKFSEVEQILKKDFEIKWVDSAEMLMTSFEDSQKRIDLFIIDEKFGNMEIRDLIEQVIMKSPMTNCAVVSSLSSKEFHELFEGLGVFTQLPFEPNRQDGERVMSLLKKILGMTKC